MLMSRTSLTIAVVLGLVALVAIILGAGQIVMRELQATAPGSVAPAPMPAGQGDAPAAVALTPTPLLMRELIRSVMPALISVILLIPSSVVVMSKNRPPDHQRWATATISSIVTYWLT
ncbi:MAG: hypothetical protein QN178_04550 [Armatimonadota bacterium]|nr:hypothetical protein [Armatimonadota bacterium]